jgi:3-oxoacyl-[acyl-carrier-protein] synthase-3
VATSTPHRYTGTTASYVGGKLGVLAPCVDVRAGCSSGIFALIMAAQHLMAGARAVAIIGADTFSAVCAPDHRVAACALGDGAAALVLGRGAGALRAACFDTDGSLAHLVSTPGVMPPNAADLARGAYALSGDQAGLEAELPTRYADAITRVLGHAQLAPGSLDWFIPHQTALPPLLAVCERAGIDPARLWSAGIARHANIGAAGWIAGLVGATEAGAATRGQTVLSASVGGGMSWGAALWTL